jgi:glycosyltransferase involved in cell wall biosynthesis
MRIGDRSSHPWKYLRREVPHHWYSDDRFPLMGFMNRDEATILYNIALQFTGKAALEIGGWLGWSSCHLALAGVRLDVIDPAYADSRIKVIVQESLAGCGVSANVHLTAEPSPEGVHKLAAGGSDIWSLFVIDGDHEGPAPLRDVETCLPYASLDCAFVFHDLASPAVAAGLRFLQDEGFNVLIYQTQQIMGLAWRGRVTPVAHIPDPEVAWQLPHHLIGLPVSGVDFDAHTSTASLINSDERTESNVEASKQTFSGNDEQGASPCLLLDAYQGEAGDTWPFVCIVSNEIIGPFKNGGIGTAMTGLAEHLAASGCRLTILYTGGVWAPDIPLGKWKKRYAKLGIDFVALSIAEMKPVFGPVKNCGFGVPYLVFQYLAARHFDVIHFNDCTGEGNICLVAKKLGLAFEDTLLLVALHSPSQWVLELNHTMPTSLLLSVYNYAEHLSMKCADVLWSPSKYLIDWAQQHNFELPRETFVQQYCLPSQRLREQDEGASDFPEVSYGRGAPPKEIVFFARLEERKGLRLFCNAIHTLRQELAERNISVTFLGKAETCNGMSSLEYIALRSKEWQFPVKSLTNLGQPEALEYLLTGEKLAVMASPADNSPCTVYEALAWGIPFLAARTGGVPELVEESHQQHVLFECTTEGLCASLLCTLNAGGWVAAPSQSQEQIRRAWVSFHAGFKRYLTPSKTDERTLPVIAIVDGRSQRDVQVTLESLAATEAVRHVIVLNRSGESLLPTAAKFSVRNIDLSVEEPGVLDEELARFTDEAILMIHSGIRIRNDLFAAMLSSLSTTDIDGLQPAAEIIGERKRYTVLPLGGDPSFTLFEGATFTGGLLVRGEAIKRARLWRELAVESAFMGLADFCVTRGTEIWPYPQPVFEQTEDWSVDTARPIPARVKAFDECSPSDRYYMLAAGYGAAGYNAGASEQPGSQRGMALAMVDMGLLPLVRFALGVRRRVRNIRPRTRLNGSMQRLLERFRKGNG